MPVVGRELPVVERKKLLPISNRKISNVSITSLSYTDSHLLPPNESSFFEACRHQFHLPFFRNIVILKHPLNYVQPINKLIPIEVSIELGNFNLDVVFSHLYFNLLGFA